VWAYAAVPATNYELKYGFRSHNLNPAASSTPFPKFQNRKILKWSGLVDIAPALECVDVQDSSANVHGIWAKRLAGLLGRHPELRMGGIKYQVQRLKKLVDAPCFSSAF
jgi:hypothetical protein